jgi:glyoxylase-like metal-dependent hydrolase (beta-lactamase superfamily II)
MPEPAEPAEAVEIHHAVCGPLDNNLYVLIAPESRRALVVDAPPDGAAAVRRLLAGRGLPMGVVAQLVLTHHHWDHVAEAGQIAAETGASVAAHRDDAPLLAQPQRSAFFPDVEVAAVPVARELAEGDVVALGTVQLRVLHTPGHTPGSLCLYLPGQAMLLSGDTLFAGSYGRVDLPGGDAREMQASLRRLAQLPPQTRVFPGHGAATTIGAEPWLPR